MFPEIKGVEHKNVRVKNVARHVYLTVTTEGDGKYILGTTGIKQVINPDLDFSLFYYTSAEKAEMKLVLFVHQSSKTCLSITSDKKVKLSALTWNSDSEDVFEEPLIFTKADNRFFSILPAMDSLYAFKGMNCEHSNYFLYVNESNELDVLEHDDTNYPEEMLFSIEDFDAGVF